MDEKDNLPPALSKIIDDFIEKMGEEDSDIKNIKLKEIIRLVRKNKKFFLIKSIYRLILEFTL